MQVIRQSLRPVIIKRCAPLIQQIRFDGGDPRSSTTPENHKSGRQSDTKQNKDLNKSKGSEKKQKPPATDDTKQPGTTRKDWSKPHQVASNDPPYG